MNGLFGRLLVWLLLHEGGYVNHPRDPGGATNRGVTQRVYNAWRRLQGLPSRSVRYITQAEVEQIYREQYWAKIWGDRIADPGVAYAMLDFGVNSGVARSVKFVQRIVGVSQDGIMGAVTLDAVNRHPPLDLIAQLCANRMTFLRGLKHWGDFGRGWARRVVGDTPGAQPNHDTGVLDRATMLSMGHDDQITAPVPRQDGAGAKADQELPALVAFIIRALRGLLEPKGQPA